MINEALEDLAIDIESVGFDPSNARKHDAKNIEAIKASLSKFGQRSPIVVQKQGMIARAGNGRLEAARALGWSKIAAIVLMSQTLKPLLLLLQTIEQENWPNGMMMPLVLIFKHWNRLKDDILIS